MKKIYIIAMILCSLVTAQITQAQDPLFSQFYNVPIYYNPSIVGLNPGLRARLAVRDQWSKLPGDLRNINFSMDFAERNIPGSGGLGLIVMTDNAGTGYLKTSIVGLSTAVRIDLQENMVTQVGIMTSFVQKTINWQNLVFSDQLDPIYGNIYESNFVPPDDDNVIYPDFSAGGTFRFTETTTTLASVMGTFGVAMHHLFRPNESFLGLTSPLPRKLTVTGDMILELDAHSGGPYFQRNDRSKNLKFNPGFIYEMQSDFKTYSVGVNVLKSAIYTGVWFRNRTTDIIKSNDLIFVMGINAAISENTRFKLNYSYDFVLTEIRPGTGASHEVTITFELDKFTLLGSKDLGFGFSPKSNRSKHELECTPF